MKAYAKSASLHYAEKRSSSLTKKMLPKKRSIYTAYASVPKAISPTVANVMDVTNFLAKYLSGNPNVVVQPRE